MSVVEVLQPHATDLGGGLVVKRALPHLKARAVGPFVFLDHFGPHRFAPGTGMDVRPHPHIGLATVTWLFEGAIMHRDSLSTVQRILPGEVNWMSAGSGIAHSERTPDDTRAAGPLVHGLQFWVALPEALEESAPSFQHVAADALPAVRAGDAAGTLVIGAAFGAASPVAARSRMLLAPFSLPAGGRSALPLGEEEQALYVVEGALDCAGHNEPVRAGQFALLAAGGELAATAREPSRFVLLGGQSLGPRFVVWNFVSSRRERIERAKLDWKEGRFARVPGETEFIPLPAHLDPAPGKGDASGMSSTPPL